MTTVRGKYFDGKSSRPVSGNLTFLAGAGEGGSGAARLQIELGAGAAVTYSTTQAYSCPSPETRALVLEFFDGAKFEADQMTSDPNLLSFDRVSQRAWEKYWRACASGLVMLMVLGVLSYQFALPLLAYRIALAIPQSVAQTIAADFQRFIGKIGVDASDPEQAKLAAAAEPIKALYPELPLSFRVCCSKKNMMNAFALPDGEIIATAQLVAELSPDELTAILLHEVGHVSFHHPMRMLVEERLFSGIVIASFGQGNAYGWSGSLLSLAHDRAFEKEADLFAGKELLRFGLSARVLAQALQHIEKVPQGHLVLTSWLATHPMTNERKRYLDELAEQK